MRHVDIHIGSIIQHIIEGVYHVRGGAGGVRVAPVVQPAGIVLRVHQRTAGLEQTLGGESSADVRSRSEVDGGVRSWRGAAMEQVLTAAIRSEQNSCGAQVLLQLLLQMLQVLKVTGVEAAVFILDLWKERATKRSQP